MNEEKINELIKQGFKRWQKNGMDRLYINSGALGLTCSYYNTGNISSATFDGEHVSNSAARRYKAAKTYIDLVRHEVVSDISTLAWAAAKPAGLEVSGASWDTILSY